MDRFLKNKRLFIACVGASIVSHIFSMFVVQKQLIQNMSVSQMQAKSEDFCSLQKIELDQILKTSFETQQTEETETTRRQFTPLVESFENYTELHVQPLSVSSPYMPPALSFLSKEASCKPNPKVPIPLPSLPALLSMDLSSLYQAVAFRSVSLPSVQAAEVALEHLPFKESVRHTISAKDVFFLPNVSKMECAQEDLPSLSNSVERVCKPPVLTKTVQWPQFPSLEQLQALSCSDFFDLDVAFAPLDNQEAYLFALTLIPKPHVELPKMQQSYSFLIDCSNSIQKERLAFTKNAVLRALEELSLEDCFNIIAFDGKLEKFSPVPKPVSSSSIKEAKGFLEKVHLGNFFSPASLYKPLIASLPMQADGVHTAILLTDGETLGKKSVQKDVALQWTAYNNGQTSLFAIGLNSDPHTPTLDAIAALNRGKTSYTLVNRGIKRKLLKLIKTISHPIAKDLSVHAIHADSENNIAFFPQARPLSHLYLHEPYVLLGTTQSLEPFVFFLQGKGKNQWLNIKKTISFTTAKKANVSLKTQWALQNAYERYKQYLVDADHKHLVKAQELLAPHNLEVAFQ